MGNALLRHSWRWESDPLAATLLVFWAPLGIHHLPAGNRNDFPDYSRFFPPSDRRILADVRPPASVPRGLGAAGEADTANGSPRMPTESSDSRSKPKVVAGTKFAEGSPPEPAQSTSSASGFKLLPASCWSGGASRWKWWASGSWSYREYLRDFTPHELCAS